MPKKRGARQTKPAEFPFAALIDTTNGRAALVEPGSSAFDQIAGLLTLAQAGTHNFSRTSYQATGSHAAPSPSSPYVSTGRRTTNLQWLLGRRPAGAGNFSGYQWLTGTVLPSLRQRLLPDPDDFVAITEKIDFFRKNIPWVNRAINFRAGLDASEFSVVAPGPTEEARKQTEWMLELKRDLRMYSVIREFFWQLRAFHQCVVLWKTEPGKEGLKPLSIECPNLQVYQPRFDPRNGAIPRIVAVPSNDQDLIRLLTHERSGNATQKSVAAELLARYPKVLVNALRDSRNAHVEVPAAELEADGYHFEYAAFDRRHYEDWGFPGIYTIIPYLEMLMLGDDADINALHHYKAGILLVRIGPTAENLRVADSELIAGDQELEAINKKLLTLGKARLPAWAARGDLRIDWVVPPEHIISQEKVQSAKERVLDWLGIPKIAWPGQEGGGSFGTAHVVLKFLQQESQDARSIAAELFERWFYERAKSSNSFDKAVWPIVRFNPNALAEPRIVLEMMRLFMQSGGADMQTIAEMAGYHAEVWLARRREIDDLKKDYKGDFDPEFIPPTKGGGFTVGQGKGGGRPTTGQPNTPEGDGLRQPRPSTAEAEAVTEAAGRIAEREFGVASDEFRAAIEKELSEPESSKST